MLEVVLFSKHKRGTPQLNALAPKLMIVAPTPTHARILSAAQRCFRQAGVNRTTVEQVAREAGLSRKTVYRLFGDRQGLISGVLRVHFRDTIEALRVEVARHRSFPKAVVEGPLSAIRSLRAEPIFQELIFNEESRGVNLVLNIDGDVRDLTRSVWAPVFAKARADGILVSGVKDVELIDGLISMVSMLVLRNDMTEIDIKRFLQYFLVPSLVGRSSEKGTEITRKN